MELTQLSNENQLLRRACQAYQELLDIAIEIDDLYHEWYETDDHNQENLLWEQRHEAHHRFRAALAELKPVIEQTRARGYQP